MKLFTSVNDTEIARLLNAGMVGVIRTDTLYGLVGRVDDQAVVERIFSLKGRDDTKSPIVLIANTSQLFDEPDLQAATLFESVWPGKVSVIVPSTHAPAWITRGNQSVAYRQPYDEDLRRLLAHTGPLVAPSANPQGQPPAMNIQEAISYFGDSVEFYVDGGQVRNNAPSRLIRMNADGQIEQLR